MVATFLLIFISCIKSLPHTTTPGLSFPLYLHCKDKIPKFRNKHIYRGLSPNFHIHASVSELYIPTISLPILLEEICRPILGLYKSLTDMYMSVEIRAGAAVFPEKEYTNGIFVALYSFHI
jgi:hypothetical protein